MQSPAYQGSECFPPYPCHPAEAPRSHPAHQEWREFRKHTGRLPDQAGRRDQSVQISLRPEMEIVCYPGENVDLSEIELQTPTDGVVSVFRFICAQPRGEVGSLSSSVAALSACVYAQSSQPPGAPDRSVLFDLLSLIREQGADGIALNYPIADPAELVSLPC